MSVASRKVKLVGSGRIAILLVLVGIIVLSVFAVYANSINGSFLCDDIILIRENNYIKNFDFLGNIFKTSIGTGYRLTKSYAYRPLQMLSYAIDYRLYRLNATGYHVSSVLIHSLAALALFLLVLKISGSIPAAFVSAIIFAIHPVQSEAVAYISSRADPLSALFVISGVYLYVKAGECPGIKYLAMVSACYCLALLSREGSIAMLFLAAAYDYSFRKRFNTKALIILVALTVAYAVFRAVAVGPSLMSTYFGTNVWHRLPGVLVAISDYSRLVFVPLGLHMEYGNSVFTAFDYRMLCGVAIIVLSAAYLIHNRRKRGTVYFWVLWFYIALAPQLNIYPVSAYMAEHWLYLPLAAFAALVGVLFANGYSKDRYRPLSIAILLFILTAYFILTAQQNRFWRDAMSFYRHTLKYAPDSARMNNDFGVEFIKRGFNADAERLFVKALEIQPVYPDAIGNLANIYKSAGRFEEAARLYKRAIELAPYNVTSYYNLGILYFFTMNRQDEAIKIFEKAVSVDPASAEALHNLALVYSKTGRQDEAISLYNKAISINPDIGESHLELGYLYYAKGKYEDAYRHLKKAQFLGANVDASFLKFMEKQK